MGGSDKVPWETCRVEDCIGEQLDGVDVCWGHASEDEAEDTVGEIEAGRHITCRGVTFSADDFHRLLSVSTSDDGQSHISADFASCVFPKYAQFYGVQFGEGTWFAECTFGPGTAFSNASFHGPVFFDEATFAGDVRFDGVTFGEAVAFRNVTFGGEADFTGATFDEVGSFVEAKFSQHVGFDDATVRTSIDFSAARADRRASFTRVAFGGEAIFERFSCGADLDFTDSTFERARQLGPVLTELRLVLDGTVWQERPLVEVSAFELSCQRARFLAGVQLRTHSGEVSLDEAEFAGPSILTRAAPFPGQDGSTESSAPWLSSVAGADVAGLTVSGMDLRACHFADAHNLDRLRAGGAYFSRNPKGWWRARRQVIAEEQEWRARHARTAIGRTRWIQAMRLPPTRLSEPLGALHVAAIYRELRKGREDSRDEPGAADFYYGEMEMRRQATSRRHFRRSGRSFAAAMGEHVILTLYWLFAGYGLRAWRAMAGLAALVVLAGAAFAKWGIAEPDDGDLSTGLLAAARATTALLGPTATPLTTFGEWLQLALRILGPALLGLAVLSIRGRVRR